MAGIGTYLKRLRPEIKIIGVEPYGASAMHDSLNEGSRVTLKQVDTFADGVAVKVTGAETFRLAQGVIDEVLQHRCFKMCNWGSHRNPMKK